MKNKLYWIELNVFIFLTIRCKYTNFGNIHHHIISYHGCKWKKRRYGERKTRFRAIFFHQYLYRTMMGTKCSMFIFIAPKIFLLLEFRSIDRPTDPPVSIQPIWYFSHIFKPFAWNRLLLNSIHQTPTSLYIYL